MKLVKNRRELTEDESNRSVIGHPLAQEFARVICSIQTAADVREHRTSHNDDNAPEESAQAFRLRSLDPDFLPYWLTVAEAAVWLRTTPKALYARVDRQTLPGAVRDGRRLLVRRDALLKSLVAVAGEGRAEQ